MNAASAWACPACNHALRRAHATHGVFACDACGGIWTDHAATQALRTVDDGSIASASALAAAQAAKRVAADRPGRCCPVCRGALSQTTLTGVALDYCVTHGTWFDRGEIAAVCEAAKKGNRTGAGAVALGVVEVCVGILSLFG